MAKPKKSKTSCWPQPAREAKTPSNFTNRELKGVNPLKEQFEPTEAIPVRQRQRMAGY